MKRMILAVPAYLPAVKNQHIQTKIRKNLDRQAKFLKHVVQKPVILVSMYDQGYVRYAEQLAAAFPEARIDRVNTSIFIGSGGFAAQDLLKLMDTYLSCEEVVVVGSPAFCGSMPSKYADASKYANVPRIMAEYEVLPGTVYCIDEATQLCTELEEQVA